MEKVEVEKDYKKIIQMRNFMEALKRYVIFTEDPGSEYLREGKITKVVEIHFNPENNDLEAEIKYDDKLTISYPVGGYEASRKLEKITYNYMGICKKDAWDEVWPGTLDAALNLGFSLDKNVCYAAGAAGAVAATGKTLCESYEKYEKIKNDNKAIEVGNYGIVYHAFELTTSFAVADTDATQHISSVFASQNTKKCLNNFNTIMDSYPRLKDAIMNDKGLKHIKGKSKLTLDDVVNYPGDVVKVLENFYDIVDSTPGDDNFIKQLGSGEYTIEKFNAHIKDSRLQN